MITAWITDTRKVEARFDRIAPSVRDHLRKEVERLALKLVAHVKDDYLSGRALNRKTGTLSRSINELTTATDTTVTAKVGANMAAAKYAGYWEYGYSGTEAVREHLRMMTQAFGRPVKDPRAITVSAHSRRVNNPGRPFLRPALADMKSEIVANISRAIKPALK